MGDTSAPKDREHSIQLPPIYWSPSSLWTDLALTCSDLSLRRGVIILELCCVFRLLHTAHDTRHTSTVGVDGEILKNFPATRSLLACFLIKSGERNCLFTATLPFECLRYVPSFGRTHCVSVSSVRKRDKEHFDLYYADARYI